MKSLSPTKIKTAANSGWNNPYVTDWCWLAMWQDLLNSNKYCNTANMPSNTIKNSPILCSKYAISDSC